MFVRKVLDALQLDDEYIFDQDIDEVFSHLLPLVAHGKRSLSGGSNSASVQFQEQCAFINFLQESRA
jgi:hypothetical protein